MMTTYEQWKENDYLYPMVHTYLSDRLIKQIFDAGKKIGVDSEKSKHKWIPVVRNTEEYDKLVGKRVFIKSELGCTNIGCLKEISMNGLDKNNICYIPVFYWYDDDNNKIDESFDKIIAYQLLPTD
jgi:hypothetical protein